MFISIGLLTNTLCLFLRGKNKNEKYPNKKKMSKNQIHSKISTIFIIHTHITFFFLRKYKLQEDVFILHSLKYIYFHSKNI